MSTRNSISILNELSQRDRILISYDIRFIGDVHNPLFECTGKYGNIISTARASSKKMARELCANDILLKVRRENGKNVVQEVSTSYVPLENYISQLNEYCAKNQLPQPDYLNEPTFGMEHIIKCQLSGLEFIGSASNKKIAKQIAAKKMLEKFVFNEKAFYYHILICRFFILEFRKSIMLLI